MICRIRATGEGRAVNCGWLEKQFGYAVDAVDSVPLAQLLLILDENEVCNSKLAELSSAAPLCAPAGNMSLCSATQLRIE